jgi:HlyD family secretion protein
VLQGSVQTVNQYAEPSGWRQANVKEYKAKVSIDEAADFLRSGMTASVTIRCAYVPNAIQIPVQAVYVHGREYFSFVYSGGKWEARPVKCGPNNDEFFVIEDGLKEGETVAMSPRSFLDQVTLPELPPETERQTTRSRPRTMPEYASTVAKQDPAKPATDDAEPAATSTPTAGGL